MHGTISIQKVLVGIWFVTGVPLNFLRVEEGTRTPDPQIHNLVL